jgi:polyisoprenoid-binding protein YceI
MMITRAIAVIAALVLPAGASAACSWTVDKGSTLGFTATMQGAAFSGRFGRFEAMIDYDPRDPARAQLRVTVPLASVDTQFAERDDELKKADWFDIATYPSATYNAEGFTPTSKNTFVTKGSLSLRGKSVAVPLNFILEISGARATVTGGADLRRLDFALGWPDTSMVADAVRVTFALTATRDTTSCPSP